MRKIRWLHISDLHLNRRGVETVRLRKKLPDYLRSLGIQCDYVFCTGDLRYAPDGGFPEDTAARLMELCRAVAVPAERLFVVPGNHDIQTDAAGRNEAVGRLHDVRSEKEGHGYYDPMTGMVEADDLAAISRGKSAFADLMKELYDSVPGRAAYYANAEHPHFVVQTEELNILHVDSAIAYTGANEREKDMIIGTEAFQQCLEDLNPAKQTVLLTHYSFDFLGRDEQKEVEALLKDYGIRLWLAGHEHNHLIRMRRDYFYEAQCGNLQLEKGAKACILLGELDLDTGSGLMKVHAWFPGEGWAPYPFVRTGTEDDTRYPFALIPAGSG